MTNDLGKKGQDVAEAGASDDLRHTLDEEMSEDELENLAAAGIPGQKYDGDDNANYFFGGAGDDEINGEGGNDYLVGNAGNDTIDGGIGDDRMVGGTGQDVFVFDGSSGHDTIADFNPLEDRLEFEGVDPKDIVTTYDPVTGNSTMTFGDNSITFLGVNLLEDTSGSGGGASW